MSTEGQAEAPRRFPPGTTIDDLKAYMVPFVAALGYKLNTDAAFADEVLTSEIAILDATGDVYCPCRLRTGNPKEDARIVCPCIPFNARQFAAMRKCWCGLFIRSDVEDGTALMGIVSEPEPGVAVDVPVCSVSSIAPGQIRRVFIAGREYALARIGDEFFAIANICRHAFGPLADGTLDGDEVVCPRHGWRYNVRTGKTDHPDADVQTFPAFARDGLVFTTV